MKAKELVIMALLVGMGAVLNNILPSFLGSVKPDLTLVMMFLGIILFPKVKNVLLLGVVTGIVTAFTTNFPGGQFPNSIEKPITAFIFFGLFFLTSKITSSNILPVILTAIGTVVSGLIFLSLALVMVGLPGGASLMALFIAVVLPTTAVNAVIMFFIHPIVKKVKS